jgi:hypothetical protein
LSFEIAAHSKELLQRHNILYKEKGHILEFARKKRVGNDKNFGAGLPNLPIKILVRVNNPRFWSVTDFEAIKKNSAEVLLFELEKSKNNQFSYISEKKKKAEEEEEILKYGLPSPFAILLLDLNYVSDAKELVLPFNERPIILKFNLFPAAKDSELFELLRKQREVKEDCESGIILRVETGKDQKCCVLTSTKPWALREENPHQNKAYFTFQFKTMDITEGAAKLYLPFPSRITSRTIKKGTIEQEVRLPRFAPKPKENNS